MANLSTRFTRAMKVQHPIVSAPMAFAGGGALAAAVWFGEAAGLIDSIQPAEAIVERMVAEAALQLARHGGAEIQ